MSKQGKQAGFTLLEMIVVIAIMGFLVAMVAPRFAGMVDGTVTTVSDSNQMRLAHVIAVYSEKNQALPNTLINIATGTAGALVLYEYGGYQWFNCCLVDDNLLWNHALTADEVEELADMGITTLLPFDGGANFEIVEGTMVAMVGGGLRTAGLALGDFVGAPKHLFRILLGVGTDSSLATRGYITEAGLCPGGMAALGRGDIEFNNYLLVLPRLRATVIEDIVANNNVTFSGHLYGYTPPSGATGRLMTLDLTEGQDLWMFATQCPEGCRWPMDVSYKWQVVAAE